MRVMRLLGAITSLLLMACNPLSATLTPTVTPTAVVKATTAAQATATSVPPTPASSTAAPTRAATPSSIAPTRPALPSSAPTLFDPSKTTIRLEPVLGGLTALVDAKHAGDGSGRLFIVGKRGAISIVRDGKLLTPTPFLDITPIVNSTANERGLLGLAFHPNYQRNGYFFVNYSDRTGDTVVARYTVSNDANRADPNSAVAILTVKQPAANHNGGGLAFGPDGYLYIGLGDGGGAGDNYGNSQKPDTLLAKMLRIDVDRGQPYAIPSDNPFVNRAGFRPEIWAWGLRNPWRYAFDRATGDLYIADVGQNAREEVNFQSAASRGGENYGWNKMEGSACFPQSARCDTTGFVLPIGEVTHGSGDCSITGGYVYRGKAYPALTGAYLFGDFCTGRIWSLHRNPAGAWIQTELLNSRLAISSFGEDEQGELYVLSYNNETLYRVVGVGR